MFNLLFILAMLGIVCVVLPLLVDKLQREAGAKRLAREIKKYYKDRPWGMW